MLTLPEKARCFRALHKEDGIFIMPNAWDPGSAIVLANAGFEAIGTTSAGIASQFTFANEQFGHGDLCRFFDNWRHR